MTYYPDLEPIDYFPINPNVLLRAVGWLGEGYEFSTGEVPPLFFKKLCQLTHNPWQPFITMGFHTCEICQFQDCKDTARGKSNLFIPFDRSIYVAPELIVHYINAHHYQPPAVFLDAVMACPNMQSIDYKKSLFKNGGRRLIELAIDG